MNSMDNDHDDYRDAFTHRVVDARRAPAVITRACGSVFDFAASFAKSPPEVKFGRNAVAASDRALHAIAESGPMTVAELATALAIPAHSASAVMGSLVRRNRLFAVGKAGGKTVYGPMKPLR